MSRLSSSQAAEAGAVKTKAVPTAITTMINHWFGFARFGLSACPFFYFYILQFDCVAQFLVDQMIPY
jgi:hypothetical protein